MKYVMLAALLLLAACTSTDTPSDQKLGEGNKDVTLAMFDSVATTRATAKLRENDGQFGGSYLEPMTYEVPIQEEYEAEEPVLDAEGNPIVNADGTMVMQVVTRTRTVMTTRPVIGPDGKVIYKKAQNFRNLVIMNGSSSISQTSTTAGESSGTQSLENRPSTTGPTTELEAPITR